MGDVAAQRNAGRELMRSMFISVLALALALASSGARAQSTAAAPAATTPAPPAPAQKSKSKFTSADPIADLSLPPFYRFRDGNYVLGQPFKFTVTGSRVAIVVPAGFVTDFASIPAPFTPAFAKDAHDLPALVHDFLYWTQSCSRNEADKLFLRALREVGVPAIKSEAIYWSVHLAGMFAWKENASDRAAGLPRVIPGPLDHLPIATWEDFRNQLRAQRIPLDVPEKQPTYCNVA